MNWPQDEKRKTPEDLRVIEDVSSKIGIQGARKSQAHEQLTGR